MMEALDPYSERLKEYFQDEKPEQFNLMEQKGTLMPFLKERGEKAHNQQNQLIMQGMGPIEAREMVWEDLMALPSDNSR